MIHVTFVMEQQVGHRTYYQNLRKFIDAAPEVAATWVPVTYENGGAYWSNWSFLPQRVRGPLSRSVFSLRNCSSVGVIVLTLFGERGQQFNPPRYHVSKRGALKHGS